MLFTGAGLHPVREIRGPACFTLVLSLGLLTSGRAGKSAMAGPATPSAVLEDLRPTRVLTIGVGAVGIKIPATSVARRSPQGWQHDPVAQRGAHRQERIRVQDERSDEAAISGADAGQVADPGSALDVGLWRRAGTLRCHQQVMARVGGGTLDSAHLEAHSHLPYPALCPILVPPPAFLAQDARDLRTAADRGRPPWRRRSRR